jgi:hypothetical protein
VSGWKFRHPSILSRDGAPCDQSNKSAAILADEKRDSAAISHADFGSPRFCHAIIGGIDGPMNSGHGRHSSVNSAFIRGLKRLAITPPLSADQPASVRPPARRIHGFPFFKLET